MASRPSPPKPLDVDALADFRGRSASPSPWTRPQVEPRRLLPMFGSPSPSNMTSITASAPLSLGANLARLPLSPRVYSKSVGFSDFMQVGDITPGAETYGENPSFFNFDKSGAHIHYIDQTGGVVRAPYKDASLPSPVGTPSPCMASSLAQRSLVAGSVITTQSPFGFASPSLERPRIMGPAGATPYAAGPPVTTFFPSSPAQSLVRGEPAPMPGSIRRVAYSCPTTSIGGFTSVPSLGRNISEPVGAASSPSPWRGAPISVNSVL